MPRNGVSIAVDGLNDVVRALRKAGVDVNEIRDVFGKISAEAAAIISAHTPVLTGRARRSIRGSRQVRRALVRGGGARVQYLAPLNYGWRARGIRPREFMQSADEPMATRAPQILDDGITEILRQNGLL